jgi:hypothetical protein
MFGKVALLVATPLLLVAACASEGDGDAVQVETGEAAVSALRSAPDAAAEAGTARFEMVMEMAMLDESFEIVATGAYDTGAGQVTMSMDMGALFEQLAATSGEELPGSFGDGAMELVVDGDTIYLRSPLFEMFTGASEWLSMSPDELATGGGGLGFGSSDPSTFLESLRGVGGEPEVVGQEDVRDVETTHYRATMNLAQALEAAPEGERAEVEAALEQLGDIDDAGIPVDIWIDGDDLPRRMRMDMGAAFGAITGSEGVMTMTMELFDYGEPVDIEVPSPDEVTPFSEVMGGLGEFGAAG